MNTIQEQLAQLAAPHRVTLPPPNELPGERIVDVLNTLEDVGVLLLKEEWNWSYECQFGHVLKSVGYAGALIDRLEKLVRVRTRGPVPDEIHARLQTLCTPTPGAAVWIDHTDHLDWEAGAFGDEGSILWNWPGQNPGQMRKWLEDCGVSALRAYADQDGERGPGQARLLLTNQTAYALAAFALTGPGAHQLVTQAALGCGLVSGWLPLDWSAHSWLRLPGLRNYRDDYAHTHNALAASSGVFERWGGGVNALNLQPEKGTP